jgi:addiction module HigA family antidote
MIRSFRSKPLRSLWENADASKIAPQLRARIERRLDALDQATTPEDTNIPEFDFHGLSGARKGTYSVHINGPWCITFRWNGLDAVDVDLKNYHKRGTTRPMNDPATHRNADRQPTHPGAILRDDVLPSLDLAVSTAAEMLGVSRQMLHRVLSERAAITPEMAVRIGKLCGNGPRLWLAMQQAHDLWHAERNLAEQVERIPTMHAV